MTELLPLCVRAHMCVCVAGKYSSLQGNHLDSRRSSVFPLEAQSVKTVSYFNCFLLSFWHEPQVKWKAWIDWTVHFTSRSLVNSLLLAVSIAPFKCVWFRLRCRLPARHVKSSAPRIPQIPAALLPPSAGAPTWRHADLPPSLPFHFVAFLFFFSTTAR